MFPAATSLLVVMTIILFLCNYDIQVLWKAVNGMLPKNLLRKKRMQRLHLFPNDVSFIMEQIAEYSAYWLLVLL